MRRVSSQRRPQEKDEVKKKTWAKPIFKDLRLGFEITMYFWTR